jgi:ring-1,2-phenylacetyl-CoA epoxidase subunit PaaB
VGPRSGRGARAQAGRTSGGGRGKRGVSDAARAAWPLWEVFVRSAHGLAHKHVGSLHAADADMALENARDVYTRRNEGVSVWVVKSSDVVANDPADREMLFAPAAEKTYRHPTYYTVPEGVKNL